MPDRGVNTQQLQSARFDKEILREKNRENVLTTQLNTIAMSVQIVPLSYIVDRVLNGMQWYDPKAQQAGECRVLYD